VERWSIGEAGDPIYRAAVAILGMRAAEGMPAGDLGVTGTRETLEEEDDWWARFVSGGGGCAERTGEMGRRQVGPVGRGWKARVTRLSGERD